jgi:hypothetical protein
MRAADYVMPDYRMTVRFAIFSTSQRSLQLGHLNRCLLPSLVLRLSMKVCAIDTCALAPPLQRKARAPNFVRPMLGEKRLTKVRPLRALYHKPEDDKDKLQLNSKYP